MLAAGEPITARNGSEKEVAALAIFDSSTSHSSPGALRKSWSDLNASVFGWRTSVISPPVRWSSRAAPGGSGNAKRFFEQSSELSVEP